MYSLLKIVTRSNSFSRVNNNVIDTAIRPLVCTGDFVSSTFWSNNSTCFFHTSVKAPMFHEPDRKGGYGGKGVQELSNKEHIINGLRELKKEIGVWTDEMMEKLRMDPVIVVRPGEVDKIWEFGKPEVHEKFVVTSDSDHNEGNSTCELTISPNGKGLFSGVLSTYVPKDGKIARAGYCNMKSIKPLRSFKRKAMFDWTGYTHLVLRVRGDGRSYMLNLAPENFFDLMWNDVFHYTLYTRGGPYWQVSRIPFSKFFLSSKGRVQDKQSILPLNKISTFGITAADQIDGPFRLEIDYVGVEYDETHTEEFAYEMYQVSTYHP